MALPLILFVCCAIPLAFTGLDKITVFQAALSFFLAWGTLISYWRKLKDGLKKSSLDPLTGLASCALFTSRLREEMARTQRYGKAGSLLMINPDRLKQLNLRHGEETGDCVLKEVARVLRYATRGTDLAGRWDGGHLAVVMPDTHPKDARRAAEKIRRQVSRLKIELPDGSSMGGVTVSQGLAEISTKPQTLFDLVDKAKKAAEKAKKKGRNRVEIA